MSSSHGRVPILCYHGISADPAAELAEFCVTPRAFGEQMRLLRRLGYRVRTLGELIERFDSGADLHRTAVLTFDDGYRDTVTVAAPILDEYGFRATVFAVPDWVGARLLPPAAPLASWDDLASLQDRGWEIGLHSATHADLTALNEAGLRRELGEARQTLETRLGVEVSTMAYPWGRYSASVVHAVRRAGLRAAVTVAHSLATSRSDRFALPRCAVRRGDSPIDVLMILRTGISTRSILRAARRPWLRLRAHQA